MVHIQPHDTQGGGWQEYRHSSSTHTHSHAPRHSCTACERRVHFSLDSSKTIIQGNAMMGLTQKWKVSSDSSLGRLVGLPSWPHRQQDASRSQGEIAKGGS